MPYLPPDGDLDPDLTCTLIFYPDRDEYRRALFGQLAELTNVWNWEASREDQAIIRRAWLAAELESVRCSDMACLDDVLALLAEIRDKDVCCDTISDVPGGDEITGVDDSALPPDVDRDGGTLPPDWVGDPTAYDAYLCGQAHAVAGSTDEAVQAVFDAILRTSNAITFVTILVLLFGNVISMGIAAILAGGYVLVSIAEAYSAWDSFVSLRSLLGRDDPSGLVPQTQGEMAGAYDAIVNAIYCANDASEASAALHAIVDANVTTPSYAFLLKLTYTIAMRPIFWGFGGAADRFDCTCVEPAFFAHTWTFDTDLEGWNDDAEWESARMDIPSGAASYGDISRAAIKALGGFGSGVSLLPTSLIFDFYIRRDAGVQWDLGGLLQTFGVAQGYATATWHRDVVVDLTGVSAISLDAGGYFMRLRNMHTLLGYDVSVDNIRIECDDGT